MGLFHTKRRAASRALQLLLLGACGADPQAAAPAPAAETMSASSDEARATASTSSNANAAGSGAGATRGTTRGSQPPAAAGISGAKPSAAAGAGSQAPAMSAGVAGDSAAAGGAGMAGNAGAGVAAGSGGAGGQAPAMAACDPAQKTADPTASSFKLLGGYQSLSMPPTTGPKAPVIETHPGFPEWTVYRPEPLASEDPHEIMIWGNGGCLLNSTIQGHFLLELASWGFVVVADGKPQDNNSGADPAAGGIRSGPDGEPFVMAMDWITAENDRPCSMFYQKLDVTKIGTGGQSCGGMMTMLSAADERVTTAMVFNSGLQGGDPALFASYHAPMLFLAGGSSDFLSSSATSNVNAIDNVPIFYGNLQVGHGGTWEATNGGEMGRVAVGWLKWKLQGDAALEKMFVGADCELCKPPSEWTVVKKMID